MRNHKDYDPYRLPDDEEEEDEVGACCFPALSVTLLLSLISYHNLQTDGTTGKRACVCETSACVYVLLEM